MNQKDLDLFENIARLKIEKEQSDKRDLNRLVEENRKYRNYLVTFAHTGVLTKEEIQKMAKEALRE